MKLERPYFIAAHILCWLIFLIIPIVFLSSIEGAGNSVFKSVPAFFCLLIYPATFYLNAYVLFPRLFFRRKFLLYFLCISMLISMVIILRPYDTLMHQGNAISNNTGNPMPPGPPPPQMPSGTLPPGPPPGAESFSAGKPAGPAVDIISLAFFLIIIAISIVIVMIKSRGIAIKRSAEAEAYRTKAELSSLKAQINPHFLFNTLNNIYSLAVSNNENTAPCIMMLSNIMRYVTDEATQEMVPLQNEADCIRDFIELNKLRLGSKMQFNYSIGGDMENRFIAPLLLITFVENVFKYGISNHETSEINIYLVTDKNRITFFCQNKLLPKAADINSTGVGVANARKRLEYLYPGKHSLDIATEDGYYSVKLILNA